MSFRLIIFVIITVNSFLLIQGCSNPGESEDLESEGILQITLENALRYDRIQCSVRRDQIIIFENEYAITSNYFAAEITLNSDTIYSFVYTCYQDTLGQSGYFSAVIINGGETLTLNLAESPTSPENLIASTISESQIELGWQDTANNEEGFTIECKESSVDFFYPIASVETDCTHCLVSYLNANSSYLFRLFAYNNFGNSLTTDSISISTGSINIEPPSNLEAVAISNSEIMLCWQDNSTNEDGFRIERSIDDVNYIEIDQVYEDVFEYHDYGLSVDSTYYYRIRGFSGLSYSNYSNIANAIPFSLVAWFKIFDGIGPDYGKAVHTCPDVGYILLTVTDFDNIGGYEIWLIRTDPEGNESWSRFFGTETNCYGYSLNITLDDGYIISGEHNNPSSPHDGLWLLRTDSNGFEEWSQIWYDDNWGMCGHYAEETSDGGYIIVGTNNMGANQDIILIKTNEYGEELWQKCFSSNDDDEGYCVKQTSDGGYIFTGHYNDGLGLFRTDNLGNTLWTKNLHLGSSCYGRSLIVSEDNNYIVVGDARAVVAGQGIKLWKFDNSGNLIWEKTYSGGDGRSVKETYDGGFIICGDGYNGGIVIKTDNMGNELWTQSFGNLDISSCSGVDITSDDMYIIIASGNGFSGLIKLFPNP